LKVLAAALGICCIFSGAAFANTLTTNIADYNAAKVALVDGALTVPADLATYNVTTTALPAGSTLVVTLPPNFTFASTPSLSSSGASTFVLTMGGSGAQFATFQVATSDLVVGDNASLATFMVNGAAALETLTPIADALPIQFQSAVADATPLVQGAFASEPGATALYVGAIQFIDQTAPSLGKLYGENGTDSATIVTSAIAISPQSVDTATQSVSVLNPDGTPNTLAPTDTAEVIIGGKYLGIISAFSASQSNCTTVLDQGTATLQSFTVPAVPLNTEVFFCITAGGTIPLQFNNSGFTPVTVLPGDSTDFLSAPVNIEYDGNAACANIGTCISAAFEADDAVAGKVISMTFTVDNSGGGYLDASDQTNVAFTDTLPMSLLIASPDGLSSTCTGGTASVNAATNTVSLSGLSIAAGATCTVTINVRPVAAGTILNSFGPITSDQAPTGGGFASVQLVVAGAVAAPPAIAVPTLDKKSLILLALMIAVLARPGMRRNAKRYGKV
jgi:hypothetical protein